MNTFIFVQILGAITLVISITALQQRKKENFLLLYIFANSIFALQYFLTNRITGAAVVIVVIIRGMVFLYYKKRGLKPSFAVLILFQTVVLIFAYLSWQNALSIIPLVTTMTTTWGNWQDSMKYTRRAALFAQVCWMAYDFTAGMYTGMMTNGFNAISNVIAMWRFGLRLQSRGTVNRLYFVM